MVDARNQQTTVGKLIFLQTNMKLRARASEHVPHVERCIGPSPTVVVTDVWPSLEPAENARRIATQKVETDGFSFQLSSRQPQRADTCEIDCVREAARIKYEEQKKPLCDLYQNWRTSCSYVSAGGYFRIRESVYKQAIPVLTLERRHVRRDYRQYACRLEYARLCATELRPLLLSIAVQEASRATHQEA